MQESSIKYKYYMLSDNLALRNSNVEFTHLRLHWLFHQVSSRISAVSSSLWFVKSICQPFRPSHFQVGEMFTPQLFIHIWEVGFLECIQILPILGFWGLFRFHNLEFTFISIKWCWFQLTHQNAATRVVSWWAFAQSSITACTAQFAACTVQCRRWKS